ncbi:MAG: hypothetical protein IJL30_08420 [Clostridia bacterium]|nr:hypothetical protein [Clostridia bacterium]
MKNTVDYLLQGGYDNYILPFLWLHGEDDDVTRDYMRAIHSANIGAVCVESRPHPDFAGPKWWHDMDVILEEARALGMKVWILDDSHFPTGFADGKMADAPEELCRQCLFYRTLPCAAAGSEMTVDVTGLRKLPPFVPRNDMERYDVEHRNKRVYYDDRLIGIVAVRKNGVLPDGIMDFSDKADSGSFSFRVPEGEWTLYILYLTRNRGARRQFINMTSAESCRILIDAVHEKFWQHYSADFGKTIAGFFSDEPELGNGHLYETGIPIWQLEDQAWGSDVTKEMEKRLGEKWISLMPLIWDRDFDQNAAAKVRLEYMDAVTSLVERNFSEQVGGWCRDHGVEYIGHLIEDNNHHTRTGPSLGHYFRGLGGQDMSGIDVISGQIVPQGEIDTEKRCGRFNHFGLAALAASQAAIDPAKHGNSMCEIFGAYGWKEGVRLEKYVADHCLVRNINHFVPHAFSLCKYPDHDCPPHFYNHGNDPQFKHFGKLMLYMNRVVTLLKTGNPVPEAAVLYAAESDWMGRCAPPEDVAEPLARKQIAYDFIPADVFSRPERYDTDLSDGLCVNGRKYRSFILPSCEFRAPCVENAIPSLEKNGVKVFDANTVNPWDIPEKLENLGLKSVNIYPENPDLRVLHVSGEYGIYMFVNEGKEIWQGYADVPSKGECMIYDAWENGLRRIKSEKNGDKTRLYFTAEPLHSVIVLFGYTPSEKDFLPEPFDGEEISLNDGWKRSICRSIDYPDFKDEKSVSLPDSLAAEMPHFSGFAKYERKVDIKTAPSRALLSLTDAHEGVELFVNGISAGIQIVPEYRFEISNLLRSGENDISIEVATNSERENMPENECVTLSGITGKCILKLKY